MNTFPLQIVTPDGLLLDANVFMVKIRTIDGDIAIRARHIDFLTALGMGECRIDLDNQKSRYAACMGGLVTVLAGEVRIVATTFEWLEEIDRFRAEAAQKLATEILESDASAKEKKRAEAHLRRSLVRLGVVKRATN